MEEVKKEYSAGFTKEKWPENDIAIVIELLQKQNNKNQILEEIIDSNLFQLRSPVSIKNRFKMQYNRATALNNEFLQANDYD